MPPAELLNLPLGPALEDTLYSMNEVLNNAVAAYAVKHRLLMEEVAVYGVGVKRIKGNACISYQLSQRKMSYRELQDLKKSAARKAAKAEK